MLSHNTSHHMDTTSSSVVHTHTHIYIHTYTHTQYTHTHTHTTHIPHRVQECGVINHHNFAAHITAHIERKSVVFTYIHTHTHTHTHTQSSQI